jgi:flagellar basal-body rod protein FlgF
LYRGIYTASTGMLTQEIKLDIVTNNLANVNTNGYKANTSAIKSFPQILVHRINDNYLQVSGIEGKMDVRPMIGMSSLGAVVDEIAIDFGKGSLVKTDNKFDVAIDGPGFFTVQTPFGERLTRDGSFTIGPNNELVTRDGYRVMGEHGPIKIDGNGFKVDDLGVIFNGPKEDQYVDRLKVVSVDDLKNMKKVGDNLYMVPKELPQPYVQQPYSPPYPAALNLNPALPEMKVRQGVVESSNVNSVTMLRSMIEIMRTYEANAKVVATEDQLMSRSVNDIPRLG